MTLAFIFLCLVVFGLEYQKEHESLSPELDILGNPAVTIACVLVTGILIVIIVVLYMITVIQKNELEKLKPIEEKKETSERNDDNDDREERPRYRPRYQKRQYQKRRRT